MEKNVFKKLIGRKSTGIIVTILAFVIVFGAIFSISNLTLAKDTLPGIGDIRDYIAGENNDLGITKGDYFAGRTFASIIAVVGYYDVLEGSETMYSPDGIQLVLSSHTLNDDYLVLK